MVLLPSSFGGDEMEEADLRAAHEWNVERTQLFVVRERADVYDRRYVS